MEYQQQRPHAAVNDAAKGPKDREVVLKRAIEDRRDRGEDEHQRRVFRDKIPKRQLAVNDPRHVAGVDAKVRAPADEKGKDRDARRNEQQRKPNHRMAADRQCMPGDTCRHGQIRTFEDGHFSLHLTCRQRKG
jgi:hypothetical protein